MSDVTDLRSTLFELLNEVKKPDSKMDLDRAKTVCLVADKIIDTAKTEIEFARVNGSVNSQFFNKPQLPAPAGQQAIENKSEEIVPGETQQPPGNKNSTKTLPNGNKVTTIGAVTTHKSH